MPRLPGGAATDLPGCPRTGHEGYKVVKDGRYGSPPRQLFRCVAPDGKFHRFAPEVPRQVVATQVCDECGCVVPSHRGPVTGRRYNFPVREVAAAFIAVGAGASYQQAAEVARTAADRPRPERSGGGVLVAEWLDALAPVILADDEHGHRETNWPETLVLDSTTFLARNVRTGTAELAFTVLGAYGYPHHGRGRVWALRAYHQGTATEWADLLTSLDITTPPALVVSDGAAAISNAVRQVWPGDATSGLPPVPFVKRCEHHLRENARSALKADRVDHYGSVRMELLNEAFRSVAGWEAFAASAAQPKLAAARAWVLANDGLVRTQVAVRDQLPQHHSTAALDTELGRVRDRLDSRSFVLRNARRTNLTLGLMRLDLNGQANLRTYTQLLRNHLEAQHGRPRQQRGNYDPGATNRRGKEDRVTSSLRS